MQLKSRKHFIILMVFGYLILGSSWIFFSDSLLHSFTDIEELTRLSTAKGIAFILLTSLFLYLALTNLPDRNQDMKKAGDNPMNLLLLSYRIPKWASYGFAVTISLAMLYFRMRMAVSFGERPLLILFMPPTILSSMIGGIGPGLVSTFVSALGVCYYGIPPLHSFAIAQSHDRFQWLMLIVSGILASYLNELLHRARRNMEQRRILQEIAQESLRLSEERFQLAMLGANDGLWDWNLLTDEIYYSPRWKMMLGYGDHELEPHLDTWKQLVHPEDLDRTLRLVNDLTEGRSDRFEIEFRMRHRDGRYLDILSRAYPGRNDSGRVVRLVGTHVDVTERKKAEDEIHALNEELEQRVVQRTAELVAANAELDSFSYAVSHDLRSPLRAMSGFSQALIEDYGESLDGEARVFLDQIILGSRRMGELIDGLLTLSRSTRNLPARTAINLTSMAEKILKELAKNDPLRSVNCEIERELNVQGDPAMMEVVMNNLLSNAWKYTSRKADPVIRIYRRQENDQVMICIADNGAGFDEAHGKKLFQPFQRLHRQEEFPGIGIGLATAQRIIHRHGGTIHAEGKMDMGAVFCFSLPYYRDKYEEHNE